MRRRSWRHPRVDGAAVQSLHFSSESSYDWSIRLAFYRLVHLLLCNVKGVLVDYELVIKKVRLCIIY